MVWHSKSFALSLLAQISHSLIEPQLRRRKGNYREEKGKVAEKMEEIFGPILQLNLTAEKIQ